MSSQSHTSRASDLAMWGKQTSAELEKCATESSKKEEEGLENCEDVDKFCEH